VQNKGTTAMADLKLGDRILTHENDYEAVYAFGHHSPTTVAKFYQIHSKNMPRPLEVTGDHLVYLQDQSTPIPAHSIKVGHVLHTSNSGKDGSTVTKISTVEREGIYAPLTTGGTLVVDGVVASSYVQIKQNHQQLVSDHDIIHLSLSPYRMICAGITAKFCDADFLHTEDGMPIYAHYGLTFLQWLADSNVVVQAIGWPMVLLLAGACHVIESMFGASLAPLVLFLAAVYYRFYSNSDTQKSGKMKSL